jgi:hypothetical protein
MIDGTELVLRLIRPLPVGRKFAAYHAGVVVFEGAR